MRRFDGDLREFGGKDGAGEEAGSYQRLLAALVESRELPMEPEPILRVSEWDAGEELLERQLTLV